MSDEKRRSGLWYLLPILFGIIGGVIAYFLLRVDDPKKANNCMAIGIIVVVINIVVGFSFVGFDFFP